MSVDAYIASKANVWAKTTQRSEKYRLRPFEAHITGDAEMLWTKIQGLKAYSRSTLWTRVTDYWKFLHPAQANPYEIFRRTNYRLFKNTYVRQPSKLGLDEIKSRINCITNPDARQKANYLLSTGLRFLESNEVKDGQVVGKGGKIRTVFGSGANPDVSYGVMYRALKTVGLKPHDLRKGFATQLVRSGFKDFDLCKVMGWSSIETAKSYVSAREDEELKKHIQRAIGQ